MRSPISRKCGKVAGVWSMQANRPTHNTLRCHGLTQNTGGNRPWSSNFLKFSRSVDCNTFRANSAHSQDFRDGTAHVNDVICRVGDLFQVRHRSRGQKATSKLFSHLLLLLRLRRGRAKQISSCSDSTPSCLQNLRWKISWFRALLATSAACAWKCVDLCMCCFYHLLAFVLARACGVLTAGKEGGNQRAGISFHPHVAPFRRNAIHSWRSTCVWEYLLGNCVLCSCEHASVKALYHRIRPESDLLTCHDLSVDCPSPLRRVYKRRSI